MNNIKFLRVQAGLSLKQLAELTGLSFGLISKLERGEQKAGPRSQVALMRALSCSDNFVISDDDSYIGSFDEERQEPRLLSKAEYLYLKRIGRIKEEIITPEPMSKERVQKLRERSLDWEELKAFEERPCIRRTIVASRRSDQEEDEKAITLINEVAQLLPKMSVKQLEKSLLVIKEVILK